MWARTSLGRGGAVGAAPGRLRRDALAAVEDAREEERQLTREPLVELLPQVEPRAPLQRVEQYLARPLRAGLQLRVVHERHACLLQSFSRMATSAAGAESIGPWGGARAGGGAA